jgi:UDP-glucose 4-epimerase
MKIVLVGASGYIGRNFTQAFFMDNFEVVAISRNFNGIELIDGVQYVKADFGNLNLRDLHLSESCVIFLASPILSRSSYIEKEIDSHLEKVSKFFDECLINGVRRFIYISSGGAIYGENTSPFFKWKEIDQTNPISEYGRLKKKIESMLFAKSTQSTIVVCARISNPFGYLKGVKFGSKNFIDYLAKCSKVNQIIDIADDGKSVRDYIHIEDVYEMIKIIAIKGFINNIFNIGSNEGMQISTIVSMFESENGFKFAKNYVKRFPTDPLINILDNSKFLNEFGFLPLFSIKIKLTDFIKDSFN